MVTKKAIFSGCMVSARFQNYEIASRLILKHLGYRVVDLEKFCCCGASLLPGMTDNWIHLTAYSLALAEKQEADIVTLCGNCTHNFKRTNLFFNKDKKIRNKIESILGQLELSYNGKVRVQHLIEVLANRLDDIQKRVKRRSKLKVAVSSPCQVIRPQAICSGRDDQDMLYALRNIIKSAEFDTVDYPEEDQCCGATALLFDQHLAIACGRAKLESAKTHGAEIFCVACGNCLFLLDRYQNKIFPDKKLLKIPVISVPELIAFSFNLAEDFLDFKP